MTASANRNCAHDDDRSIEPHASVGLEPPGQPDREQRRQRDGGGEGHGRRRERDGNDRHGGSPDELAAHESERPQGRHGFAHGVRGPGDCLTDEHHARERGGCREEKQADLFDVGGMQDSLVVLDEVSDRNVGPHDGTALVIAESQDP